MAAVHGPTGAQLWREICSARCSKIALRLSYSSVPTRKGRPYLWTKAPKSMEGAPQRPRASRVSPAAVGSEIWATAASKLRVTIAKV